MTDRKQRALLSVSDKTGIVELAGTLLENGWLLLSTGGTATLLREEGFPVTEVSEHTGFPEIMGGRVKTLHPKIHGGILARRGLDDEVVRSQGIDLIDLVVVNLYPFETAVSDPACTFTDAIENIDIGGPAMLRAAAKNHESVTVVTNPQDYPKVLAAIVDAEGIPAAMRLDLAVRAFEHTARYDGMIANYFGSRLDQSTGVAAKNFPRTFNLQFDKVDDLRYGENPHQQAAFYRDSGFAAEGSVSTSEQLQGKELSFNNIADTDAALECVCQFENPACVIVKHANPCGVAEVQSHQGIVAAYDLAFQTDPTSAFGGIIAFNREVNAETASAIVERQFVEVVIAPGFSDEALKAFSARENVRVLDCGSLNDQVESDSRSRQQYTRVSGGLLVQDADELLFAEGELPVVTNVNPDDSQRRDLEFAWKVAKFVKSNAIVFARNGQTIGIGAGQMSRVYSTRIAAIKAADENLQVTGAVMASDAFFPFRDGLDSAAEHGISAVIQPGGSRNDSEVIEAANEHGIAMVFTGMRHFRH